MSYFNRPDWDEPPMWFQLLCWLLGSAALALMLIGLRVVLVGY